MSVKYKGISINLGGVDYVFPPLSLGSIELLEDKLTKLDSNFSLKESSIIIDVAFASLKRNYPEITREELAELIDISNMQTVFLAVMNVSEMKSETVKVNVEGDNEEKK